MPRQAPTGREPAARWATNVTLSKSLLSEARALNVNVSQACERGLAATVAETRAQHWLQENRGAMAAWNAYLEEHGLPLAEFRWFGFS